MKLERLTLRGVGPAYPDEVSVDFASLGPGVFAICGCNGFGKTTLLEASGPGVLYREMPSSKPGDRVQIVDGLLASDGLIELAFELDDDSYIARVEPTGAFLERNGTELVSGKKNDYAARIKEIFGPKEAFYASYFAAQQGKDFSRMRVGERKALFRYYLGLGHIERLHAAVKDRLTADDSKTLDELQQQRRELESKLEELSEALVDVEVKERAAKADYDVALEVWEKQADLRRRIDLGASINRIEREIEDLRAHAEEAEEELKGLPVDEIVNSWIVDVEGQVKEARLGDELLAEASKIGTEASACEDRLSSARVDSATLDNVPCRGQGQYASCEFLHRALLARDELPKLREEVGQLTEQASYLIGKLKRLPDLSETEALEDLHQARDNARSVEDVREDLQRAIDDAGGGITEKEIHIAEINEELEGLPEGELPDDLRKVLDEARERWEAALGLASDLRARHAAAKEEHARVDREHREAYGRNKRHGALKLLERTLGPKGLQAFEIDRAGPRVSELANELLATSFDGQFTISVPTRRALKKGGEAEDFAVRIHDSKREPIEGGYDFQQFSNGQQVVIGEAVRMALSLFSAERSERGLQTLWRDEPSGHLSDPNYLRYVAMLRRVRHLGSFHQIFFVTHNDSAAKASDGTIQVESGRVALPGAEQ